MKPVSGRDWLPRVKAIDTDQLITLSDGLRVPSWIAHLLLARKIDTLDDGAAFLSARLADLPDPFLLTGMQEAVERLIQSLQQSEPIAIHGDYDVDGITGTALLTSVLRALGGTVHYHIPLRLKDGYGLSDRALEDAAAAGVRVVVSVDCGVSALEEAALAASLGLDLIITDHHQPPDELPVAVALINPHQPGCSFPDKTLSGVGVAFLLLVGLRKGLREVGWFAQRSEPDLREWLDLVALGTIADLVPLTGLNRTLVKHGLILLEQGTRVGVQALKKVAQVQEVTAGVVGFRLAPRLNAAGRLEDAALGVELLLAENAATALTVAEKLDQFNQERRLIEKETFDQAVSQLEDFPEQFSIVLADTGWHSGVIGIVASRLVERYGRPTLLIALDEGEGKGSGRSVRGFHLYRGLKACAADLLGYGGHEFAAGFSVTVDAVSSLIAHFEEQASLVLKPEDLRPSIFFDGEIELEEIDQSLVEAMAGLAPFGMGNPEPVLLVSGVALHRIEAVGDGSHLRCVARQGGHSFPCIAFGMAERRDEFDGPCDLLVTPVLNDWKGRVSVQLRLKDIRSNRPD